jgi:lipopolysaccharide biosynthesis regulator YciM
MMRNLFSNKEILISELESWYDFANNLTQQQDKEMFNKLVRDYSRYVDVLVSNDNDHSFPSEPLITALIISQQKKIISWLISKLSE